MEFFRPTNVAEALSIDSDASPYNWGTAARGDVYDRPGCANRVTYMNGQAVVKKAAAEVVRKVKSRAADILECDVSDLELRRMGVSALLACRRKKSNFEMCHCAPLGASVARSSAATALPAINRLSIQSARS